MFDSINYYKTLNTRIYKEYSETLKHIKVIKEKTAKKNKYNDYFHNVSSFILMMCEFEKNLNDEYFTKNNFDQLLSDNHKIYEDIKGDNYNVSYANPKFAASKFGLEIGQILAYHYASIRNFVMYAFHHRVFDMYVLNDIFVRVYEYVSNNKKINVDKLKAIVTSDSNERLELKKELWVRETLTPEISYNADIVRECDLEDLRYLFRYGRYITDNEIRLAGFINSLDDKKINEVANTFTEGYRLGFIRDNKNMSIKNTASIRFQLGQERIIRKAIENFNNMGLVSYSSILFSTEPSKQFIYDHRFDEALYFDEEYATLEEEATKKALELLKDYVKGYAGPALLESFGDIPFKPESYSECVKLSKEQNELKQDSVTRTQIMINEYVPRSEWSFVIMALPVPNIGDKFEEIFEEICKVNTLDNNLYEGIQQKIIDTLDQGEFVHVKGKNGNETDIKVALQKIEDPAKQSNFVNCIADVNVPLGEVFTTPKLTGTNGVLHVEEVYLRNDLKYENLKITFKDGFIDEYSCTNFDSEEENKKYIEENLMFPHKTLPLGEFAIGTNTTAYVMANKYDIVGILPILIVEKMGPHFAVGDTCFLREEDKPVYNSNKKEITARDNEKSIKRKENPKEAYTNVHTDITLPYDGLESITVIKNSGENVDVLRDGRFVLPGTEELNKPFE